MLCPSCQDDYDAWLDVPMIKPPSRLANSAAYDYSSAGVAANRRCPANEHWRIVRFQTELIKKICKEQHGLSSP